MTIFTEYNPIFAKWLLDRTPEEVKKTKKGTLVFLDDIGCNSDFNSKDPHWFRLIGQQRHERVSTVLNFHSYSSQRILSPFVRQNCNYLFLFNLSNWRIINSLWQESLSTTEDYANWKVFFGMFKKHTRGEFDKKERKMIMNYNALAVHTTGKLASIFI